MTWILLFTLGCAGLMGVMVWAIARLDARDQWRREMAALSRRCGVRPNRRIQTAEVLYVQLRPLGLPGVLISRRDRIPRDTHHNVLN